MLILPYFVFAALLAVQSLYSLHDGYRFLAYLRRSLDSHLPAFHPPATVIVAVKGVDEGFESNIEGLLAQDYPDYDLVFSIASQTDAAYPYLAAVAARAGARSSPPNAGPRQVKLVVAGYAPGRGEKVNNLLAALGELPRATPVRAFADADARMKPDWLRSLVAPLRDPAVTVSTGFRWYLPGRSAASRLRAAWDASIATMFREHGQNFAWGGSMAVRLADFERLEVAKRYWWASVSDDYGLTRAVRGCGGWVRFEPRCVVSSTGEIGFRELLRWTNRQIIITRVYAPHYWYLGLASHTLFGATFLLGLAAIVDSGSAALRTLAAGALCAILMLGVAKARLRSRAAAILFPQESDRLKRLGACYWRWWPAVPWLMLLNFLTAGVTRTIEWRGVRYRLVSPGEVQVLRRDEPPA